MTIDDTQWLSIHLYLVQAEKRILIFLCVETIGVSTTYDNVFGLLLKTLAGFGGLGMEELVKKVVNMGCDGNIIFQAH
jgi:uncharacterized protein related to proFAR isomerase